MKYLVIASRSVKQEMVVTIEAENYDDAENKAKKAAELGSNWRTETDVGAWISWTILHADKVADAMAGIASNGLSGLARSRSKPVPVDNGNS